MDVEGLVERRFLLVKRGLYYGPNNSGYTGFKERAGRYLESDARPDSGVTAIHEDEADEIAPACFDDLARKYLTGKLAAATEALSRQKAVGDAMKEALEGYRAACSWIAADSWDGCSECMMMLRKARTVDWEWTWSPDETAAALQRLRERADGIKRNGFVSRDALTAWNIIGADRD